MMLTAGEDELTSYGSACIALFFVFIGLGLAAGYVTQQKVGRVGGLPCFQDVSRLQGFSNPVTYTKNAPSA